MCTVGFLVTSLLDKSHLNTAFSGDSWGNEGPAAWRARVVLFIGVALMAGGLAGSLVSAVEQPDIINATMRCLQRVLMMMDRRCSFSNTLSRITRDISGTEVPM